MFLIAALLATNHAVGGTASSAAPTFFVATNGNDHWSGTLPSPTRNKTDGPLATILRALEAARQLRHGQASAAAQPVRILIRSGLHTVTEPLILKPEDLSLLVGAYANEEPVISGGRRITGWQAINRDGRNLWAAEIPEVREGKWFFRELWINGQRAVRARHPNTGYFAVAELPDATPEWTQGHTRFRFRADDLKAWPGLTNAEVVVMTRWVESRLPVTAVDESQHLVSFSKRSVFQLAPGDLYYLEGAFELLDAPGEWYLDRAAGMIYYLPRPGETLARVEAIAPALVQVLRLEGRPEAGQFIEHVTLRGLAFSHAEWCFPEGFHRDEDKPVVYPEPKPDVGGFAQAAIGVPAAVWGEGVRDCVIEDCAFTQLGGYGLALTRGCESNRVLRCEFSDLGAGGIKLGETAVRANSSDQTGANEVSNCHIHDGGKLFPSAIGLWVGQSPSNRLTHNLIHDFYYTGISIGWTWGYGPALATNNLVAFNHVHHIGVKSDGDGPILSDMGGIYTLGMQPGTRILNNLWHDIAGFRYGGWGIYFDEGSSGIVAQSNVVYRTTHGGFHQHYGATNHVHNNIFAFARDHQIQRTRPEPHSSFSFSTNIVYFENGVLLGGNWSGDAYQLDGNLYFDARNPARSEAMRFAGDTLENWRARGHDLLSVIADPLFIAPQHNDFSLEKNSPAFKMGFHSIDRKEVGVQKLGAPR